MTAAAVVNDYDWVTAATRCNFHLFIGPNLYPSFRDSRQEVEAGEDLKMTKLIPLGRSLFPLDQHRRHHTGVHIPRQIHLQLRDHHPSAHNLHQLVLFPLPQELRKSQVKMRVLAPDIKAINDKYPGAENAMIRQQKPPWLSIPKPCSKSDVWMPPMCFSRCRFSSPYVQLSFPELPSRRATRTRASSGLMTLSASDVIISLERKHTFHHRIIFLGTTSPLFPSSLSDD